MELVKKKANVAIQGTCSKIFIIQQYGKSRTPTLSPSLIFGKGWSLPPEGSYIHVFMIKKLWLVEKESIFVKRPGNSTFLLADFKFDLNQDSISRILEQLNKRLNNSQIYSESDYLD